MISFKNVIVVASSLALLTPVLATGAGCASKNSASAKKKGGGAKGPAAATAKQKPGATASGAKASGTAKGADLEGATCNAETEGVAWCDSDTSVVLCSSGTWLRWTARRSAATCARPMRTPRSSTASPSRTWSRRGFAGSSRRARVPHAHDTR